MSIEKVKSLPDQIVFRELKGWVSIMIKEAVKSGNGYYRMIIPRNRRKGNQIDAQIRTTIGYLQKYFPSKTVILRKRSNEYYLIVSDKAPEDCL